MPVRNGIAEVRVNARLKLCQTWNTWAADNGCVHAVVKAVGRCA